MYGIFLRVSLCLTCDVDRSVVARAGIPVKPKTGPIQAGVNQLLVSLVAYCLFLVLLS